MKEHYDAMIINPCRMNMNIWWNVCHESLMVSIHKRNRILGEAKIKFEVSRLKLLFERFYLINILL